MCWYEWAIYAGSFVFVVLFVCILFEVRIGPRERWQFDPKDKMYKPHHGRWFLYIESSKKKPGWFKVPFVTTESSRGCRIWMVLTPRQRMNSYDHNLRQEEGDISRALREALGEVLRVITENANDRRAYPEDKKGLASIENAAARSLKDIYDRMSYEKWDVEFHLKTGPFKRRICIKI